MKCDDEFHLSIARKANDPDLTAKLAVLRASRLSLRSYYISWRAQDLRQIQEEHDKILQALLYNSGTKKALEIHLNNAKLRYDDHYCTQIKPSRKS